MPTHWESSERPLFVKTVVVNGNRHAILSEVDPLCQARKADPVGNSAGFADLSREDMALRRVRSCYPAKRDISSDLQNCLVRLRVVLSTQENKKMKKEVLYLDEEEKWKGGVKNENWKHIKKNLGKIKSECSSNSGIMPSIIKEADVTGYKKGNSFTDALRGKEHEDYVCTEGVTKLPDGYNGSNSSSELEIEDPAEVNVKKLERTNLLQKILPVSDSTEEIFKNYSTYFFPIVYIKSNGASWDQGGADNVKSNPLSDRVMQWLELARRRKENAERERSEESQAKGETIIQTNSEAIRKLVENINSRKHKLYYCKCDNVTNKNIRTKESTYYIRRCDGGEDVEGEVKQESDVETALSVNANEEATRQPEPEEAKDDRWVSLLSIPEKKEFSVTEQLQQSILNSFEAVVTLDRTPRTPRRSHNSNPPRKKSYREPSLPPKLARRKNLFMKQASIKMSSDEDESADRQIKAKRRVPDRHKSYRHRNEPRREKKIWEHTRRFRYLMRSKGSDDENRIPSDESGREIRILYNERSLNKNEKVGESGGRRIWAHDGGVKPQLHIFMPGLDAKFLESQEDSASDADSF